MIRTIALISPYDSFEAHGLRSLSAYLKSNGIRTKMIFLPSYTETWQFFFRQKPSATYSSEVGKALRAIVSDCDAVGITMMTVDKPRVRALIHELEPLGIPIVLGGVHPTVFPEDAIRLADRVIVGEGFQPLLEWCLEPLRKDIENLWTRTADGVIRNPIRPAIDDIDTLPFPDYGPLNHWVLQGNAIRPMDNDILGKFLSRTYHQFASLGCPFSCSYCINNHYTKIGKGYGSFRRHSVDYIIEEAKYGLGLSADIEYIDFRDDGFIFMKEEHLEEFARKFKSRINLPFSATGIIPAFLTERKLELLVSAGLRRTRLGFQSACKETLRFYRRSGDAAQYEKCNDMLQKFDRLVFPYYDIITDNVFLDPEKDALETIEFLLRLKGRFSIILYGLRVYPGTEIHRKAEELGLDKKCFEDTYMEFSHNLLNYILTLIQCSQSKLLPRLMLGLYRSAGNLTVPKFLFTINRLLWHARCALEHVRKDDVSVLPDAVVRLFHRSNRERCPEDRALHPETSSAVPAAPEVSGS
ncbi:MAG: radical SAM protein [Desulfomonilaceae bacterium]|nr:radical SAM protein [Desulfomonilaceae bacterium]